MIELMIGESFFKNWQKKTFKDTHMLFNKKLFHGPIILYVAVIPKITRTNITIQRYSHVI